MGHSLTGRNPCTVTRMVPCRPTACGSSGKETSCAQNSLYLPEGNEKDVWHEQHGHGTKGSFMQTIRIDLTDLSLRERDRAIQSFLQYLKGTPAGILVQLPGDPSPFVQLLSGLRLCTEKILYITSDRHYCNIRMEGGTKRVRAAFREICPLLPADEFLECNRGILVRIPAVAALDRNTIIMKDGMCFPIRVRQKKEILLQLRQYRFLHSESPV